MRQLLEATGENTKAGAVDVSIQHHLEDLQNEERVAKQIDVAWTH